MFGTEGGSALNLRTLRAVRVLRPLKLISGIPSRLFIFSLFYDNPPNGIFIAALSGGVFVEVSFVIPIFESFWIFG